MYKSEGNPSRNSMASNTENKEALLAQRNTSNFRKSSHPENDIQIEAQEHQDFE